MPKSLNSVDSIRKSPECITPSAFDTKSRQQSAKVGIFNLISTMIGGGALSLPFAVSRCGLVLGFSLLVLSALLSVYSFDVLIATSRRSGAMTYQQIGYYAFGRKISVFVTLIIWFNCMIASIAYCVLVGDLIQPVICYIFSIAHPTASLRRIIIAVCIGCVSPFCYMRQIGGLKYTSMISIFSILVLTGIISSKTLSHFNEDHLIYYVTGSGQSESFLVSTSIQLWPSKWDDVVYVFPVFGISFLCHFNIPQVHSELTRPTRKRIRHVLYAVVASCTLLYAIVAFFGYFYSFQFTCGNILLNYRQDDVVVTFGRMCLGFVILFTFPLLILPARTSIHNLLNECRCTRRYSRWVNLQSVPAVLEHDDDDDELLSSAAAVPDVGAMNDGSVKSAASQNRYQAVNVNEARQDKASIDGCAVQYSLMSDTVVVDDAEENAHATLKDYRKKKHLSAKNSHATNTANFMTRSFSLTSSPLRKPDDALGVISEPKDIARLREKEFVRNFQHLESSSNYQPSRLFLVIETTLMIASALLVSFLTDSVMVLWGLLGSTVGFMIAFTLPGFFYFKIRQHKGYTCRNVAALLMAIFSCICIVVCTWQALKRLSAETCPVRPN